jgi:hypothetical protein
MAHIHLYDLIPKGAGITLLSIKYRTNEFSFYRKLIHFRFDKYVIRSLFGTDAEKNWINRFHLQGHSVKSDSGTRKCA